MKERSKISHESTEEKNSKDYKSIEEKSSPFTRAVAPDNSHFIPSKTLEEAKQRNESATSRVIGMAIETRPDWIDEDEIKRLR